MEAKDRDVIEINFGKYLHNVRSNPWMASTVVLALVLVVVLVFGGGAASGSGAVGADEASERVISFIQANPELSGQVSLVSTEEEGQFYKINLLYQGQNVPVYTTKDAEFLVGNPVPLGEVDVIDTGDSVVAQAGTANQASADDDAFIGDANAPVTIIEYSDYQCGYCQRFWAQTLPEIKEKYIDTGKVKLVYRDYPLPSHPLADEAAEAAECVRAQSDDAAYFAYHDQVFAQQPHITEDNLIAWAQEQGYDIASCLESGEFAAEVAADFADGGSLGTPTFFVNGKKLEGAQPFSVFEQVIEAELAAAGA